MNPMQVMLWEHAGEKAAKKAFATVYSLYNNRKVARQSKNEQTNKI